MCSHNTSQPHGGGGQLSFQYECVAWRTENRGIENGLPPNWDLEELIFVQFEALGTEIWPNSTNKNWTFPQFWGSEMEIFQKNCDLRQM